MPRTIQTQLFGRTKKRGLFERGEPVSKYEEEFRYIGGLGKCERINSAKVCDTHKGVRMFYCKEQDPDRCEIVSAANYFGKDGVYVGWFKADPRAKGYGERFFKELKKWLEEKKCIRRMTLHAATEAEGFWERMGFQPLADVERTDEGYRRYVNKRFQPEDREWSGEYSDLRPYELVLHPPKNCRKRRKH